MVNRLCDKLFTIPRWVGFTGAILFAVLYHLGSFVFGYSIAVGWLWLILMAGGLLADMRYSLLLASFISIYAFYMQASLDITRVSQIVFISFLMALMVGYYRRYQVYLAGCIEDARVLTQAHEEAAKLLTDLSANVDKVKSAREAIQIIMFNAEIVPSTKEELGQVVHTLGNLETAAAGWLALKQIQESVMDDKLAIGEKIRRSRRGGNV